MNQQQITFIKNAIADYKTAVARLERELQNPRSRPAKNEERRRAIAELNSAIADSLKMLFDAGVITL